MQNDLTNSAWQKGEPNDAYAPLSEQDIKEILLASL